MRYRKLCIRRAVGLDLLTGDPRPRAPKGRSRRKAVRPKSVVDVRSLPHPPTMERALAEIPSHQPSSRRYQGGDAYCSDEPIPLSATLVRFNVHPADVLSCGQFET